MCKHEHNIKLISSILEMLFLAFYSCTFGVLIIQEYKLCHWYKIIINIFNGGNMWLRKNYPCPLTKETVWQQPTHISNPSGVSSLSQ